MKAKEVSHQENLPDDKPELGNGGLFEFQEFLNYDDPEALRDDEREPEDLMFIAVFGFFTLAEREEWSHIDECRMLDDGGSIYFGTGVADGCMPSYEGIRPVFSRSMFPGGWPVEIYSVSSKLLRDVDDWMEDKPRFLITVTPTKAFVTEPIQAWAYFNTSEEQVSDSTTKPTMEELFEKHGIIDATMENLGKTYITFTPTPREELATSDDGLIYLAVTGRLASNDFFERFGFYEYWKSFAWENIILYDANYLGWGIVEGMQVTDVYGLVLANGDDTDSCAAVEVYCVERKHIDLIETNFLENDLCDYNPPIPPRVLVTVEPGEANFSTPVKAWAYYAA